MANIHFFALGGLDEKGKNLYCLEIDESIFLFDAGNAKPERNALGVDTVIPSFQYLIKNKSRIKGLFLSNIVAESAGAVPYLLRKLNIKVYSSDFILHVLKIKTKALNFRVHNLNLNIIKPRQIISFGNIKIEAFQTTSFVPQSLGFAIHTPNGTIIYSGSFVFDQTLKPDYVMSMAHLSKIASRQKTLLLLLNSSAAGEKGYAAPRYLISDHIDSYCQEATGRIVFTCFEEDIFKIQEFLAIISKNDPHKVITVAVLGSILLDTLRYLQRRKGHFANINFTTLQEEANSKYILVSGDLELLYALLTRIATGLNPDLELTYTDTVILTSPPTKGEELHHAQVLDDLARTQAKVVALSSAIISKMTPHYQDIKMLCGVFKPQYVLTTQGLYKDFKKAAEACIEAGVLANKIIITDNGQNLLWKNGMLMNKRTKIKVDKIYAETAGTNDVEWVVLRERQQLSSDGTVVIGVVINKKTKKQISQIDVQMRGIVFMDKENFDFLDQIRDYIQTIIEKYRTKFVNREIYDLKEMRREMTSIISKSLFQKTKKRPIVLVVIQEI